MLASDSIMSGPPRPPVVNSASTASIVLRSSGRIKASSGGIAVWETSSSNDVVATRAVNFGSKQKCNESSVPCQQSSASLPTGITVIEPAGGGKSLLPPAYLNLIFAGGLVVRTSPWPGASRHGR